MKVAIYCRLSDEDRDNTSATDDSASGREHRDLPGGPWQADVLLCRFVSCPRFIPPILRLGTVVPGHTMPHFGNGFIHPLERHKDRQRWYG